MTHRNSPCIVERCHEIKPIRQFRPGWGRGEFPSGPWETEPDRVDFTAHGHPCFVHRNGAGVWCGYVGVPRSHPAFGHQYDDFNVSVHGGLTYSGKCSGHLCHAGPQKVLWWIGWDAFHSGDLAPVMLQSLREIYRHSDAHYWTVQEAIGETKRLASQLTGRVSYREKNPFLGHPQRVLRFLRRQLRAIRAD